VVSETAFVASSAWVVGSICSCSDASYPFILHPDQRRRDLVWQRRISTIQCSGSFDPARVDCRRRDDFFSRRVFVYFWWRAAAVYIGGVWWR
jgi:hypothetical protein